MAKPKDVITYFFGQILVQAITFIIGVWVARSLGPESFGVLSLTSRVFSVALILAPLGLDLSLLKHLGEHADNLPKALAEVRVLRMFSFSLNTVVAVVLGLGLGAYLEHNVYHVPGFAGYLLLTLIALPVSADIAILGAVFRGIHKPALQNIVSFYIQPFIRAGIVLTALSLGFGLFGVIGSNVTVAFIASTILSLVLLKVERTEKVGGYRITVKDIPHLAKFLKYSLWLALMLFSYGVLRSVDVLVLGRYASTKVVGEYSAISVIAQVIQIYPQALSQTLGPTIARLNAAGDRDGMRQALNGYLRNAVLISSPIFAGIGVFGPWLEYIFGARFHFRADLSFCLATAYFISAVLGPMGYALSMTGKHKQELVILVLGTVFAAGACLALAPLFGAIGVAVGVTLGYLAINVCRAAATARSLSFVPGNPKDLIPPATCLVLAFAVKFASTLCPQTLPYAIGFGALYVILFGAIYGFVILRPSEKVFLAGLVNRFRPKPA